MTTVRTIRCEAFNPLLLWLADEIVSCLFIYNLVDALDHIWSKLTLVYPTKPTCDIISHQESRNIQLVLCLIQDCKWIVKSSQIILPWQPSPRFVKTSMKLYCTNFHEWFSRTKPLLVRYHEAGKELLSGIEFNMVEPMRTKFIANHMRNDRGHFVLRREVWEENLKRSNRVKNRSRGVKDKNTSWSGFNPRELHCSGIGSTALTRKSVLEWWWKRKSTRVPWTKWVRWISSHSWRGHWTLHVCCT